MASSTVPDILDEIKRLVNAEELYRELFPENCLPTSKLLRCFGHDDTDPSLQPFPDHLFCHGSCNKAYDVFDLVMHATGCDFPTAKKVLMERCNLTETPQTAKKTKSQASEEYVYEDQDGNPYIKVVRIPATKGKKRSFPQFHWNAEKKEWIAGLGGRKPILYRLPKLVNAEEIWITEGEKDVHTLESFGFTATTAPMGAGKWRHVCEDGKPPIVLHGKKIIICGDKDLPDPKTGKLHGQKHVEDIARSVKPHAASLKVVWVPQGKDVSDFLETVGHEEAKRQLQELVAEAPEYEPPPANMDGKVDSEAEGKGSRFQRCLQTFLATGSAVFLDQHKCGWATVKIGKGYQNVRLCSSAFSRFVRKLFVDICGQGISSETIAQVADYLEASATETRHLYNRFSWRGDRLLIDMGTREWAALEITAEGYKVIHPQKPDFKRYSHEQSLPNPEPRGAVEEVLSFLPIKDPDDQILIQIWLVTAPLEHIPRPLINAHGSHGAGKTQAAILLRDLLDPSSAPVRSLSKDHAEFIQALEHNAIFVLDNIHRLPQSVSDDMSGGITGSGFAARVLYTDDEDFIRQFRRTGIVNGINSPATSPDLLDRSITIKFERILDTERREEQELKAAFAQARAQIFGAMIQALSTAMGIVNTIHLDRSPRMADWTRWGCAVAEALGIGKDRFLQAYSRNIGSQNDEIMGSEPVCIALTEFMADRDLWTGRPAELYIKLLEIAKEQHLDGEKAWPKAANAFTRRLNELQHNLREAGLIVEKGSKGRGKGKARTIIISKVQQVPQIPSPSTNRPQTASGATEHGDDMGTIQQTLPNIDRHIDHPNLSESLRVDDEDGVDDISRTSQGFTYETDELPFAATNQI